MTTADFGLTEAVPLAHALLDQVAREQGVRVLFIKGPMAALQGLRSARSSIDVDALVDPAERAVLASALGRLGWVDEHPYTSPTVLPQHSLTHRHPHWPCELDLHDRFPGFFRDRQEVFEALWARRTSVVVAEREVPCPDRAAQSLILALHSLRDPRDPRQQRELSELVELLRPTFDGAAALELAELAHELGAADTAAPFLTDLDAPPIGKGTTSAADLVAWRLRTEPDDTTAVSWVDELRHLPLRAWPHFLWYAAMLSEKELRLEQPALPPGRAAVRRARLHRLRRGLSALPRAFRDVRSLSGNMIVAGTAEAEILIVSLLRPDGDSGVQTHFQTLLGNLRARGKPAALVTPFSARSPLLLLLFALRFPIRTVNRNASVRWYRYWHAHYLRVALRRTLRRRSGRRVVIYAQCPVSAHVGLSLRTNQPVVMAAHFNVSQADEWADRGEVSRTGPTFQSIRAFEAQVLPGLDGIVYVSDFARRALEARLPTMGKVPSAVLPNFVAPSTLTQPVRHRGDLITVGTLEPRKNQSYLLEVLACAAARGHHYTLTVVGDGPDRRALERRARTLGVRDLVTFAGYRRDPRRILTSHRIYCHSARMENLPLAVMEALAEGLPVVAAAVGGIPEIYRAGVEGAFWPLDDADAASSVLIDLFSDSGRLDAMSRDARRRIEDQFSADVVVPRLEAFLADVRSSPSSLGPSVTSRLKDVGDR